jgi:LysM repeat protein
MKCTAIRCLTLALLVMTTAACGQVITRPTPASAPIRVAAAFETAAATDTPTATPVPYTPPPTFTPTMTPTPVFYYIEAGDNLFNIADKFNVPHDLLRDVNGITNERALQVGQQLLIPVGGQETPLEPTATATPTPLPMAVENVYFHPSPLGELTVLGEARNISSSDVERVLVQIILYDQEDNVLSSASNYTELEFIAPGQRSPFAVRFPEAPAQFASYEAQVLSAASAYTGSLHRDIEARDISGEQRPRAPLRLQGRLVNVGSDEAVAVLVVVTAYDPLGRVVGVRSGPPDHNVIARGGETGFDLEIAPAGPVVTYTVQAEGRRLLPTPEGGG